MNGEKALLTTHGLSIGYRHSDPEREWIIKDLNLSISRGQLICLLGPNGAGKSTLMRTISGLQNPLAGEVKICGKSVQETRPDELALRLSMVLTDRIDAPNMSAEELIALGRTPHTGWLGRLDDLDKAKINEAIKLTGVESYIHRKIHQLSDGERQKIMLARALAQDTDLILMDEPTSHLDVPNRVEMMQLLHEMAQKTGKGILISTHELDLALQIADQIWLIDPQMKLAYGMPEDMVLNGTFEQAFCKNSHLVTDLYFDKNTGSFNIRPKTPKYEIAISGDQTLQYWTSRALAKSSIKAVQNEELQYAIYINETDDRPIWILNWEGKKSEFFSLESLMVGVIGKFEALSSF